MRPDEPDQAHLLDMLNAARHLVRITQGVTFEQYVRDDVLVPAVERKIEVIGEAARRLTQSFRDKHPEIFWQGIIAQRHVLAHEYDGIDQERIYRIVSVHAPKLIADLLPLIKDPPLLQRKLTDEP